MESLLGLLMNLDSCVVSCLDLPRQHWTDLGGENDLLKARTRAGTTVYSVTCIRGSCKPSEILVVATPPPNTP